MFFEHFQPVLCVAGGENAEVVFERHREVLQRLFFVVDVEDGVLLVVIKRVHGGRGKMSAWPSGGPSARRGRSRGPGSRSYVYLISSFSWKLQCKLAKFPRFRPDL